MTLAMTMRIVRRFLLSLALPAAWFLGGSLFAAAGYAAQAAEPAQEAAVTLSTASTRLQFTGPAQGLLLRSLVDIATGTEFLPHAGEGLSVWEIVLLNPQRELCAVKAGPGATFETSRDDAGARVHRLRWPSLDLPGEPGALGVDVKIVAPPDTGFSYWYIHVANRSKVWGAWEVRFPRLERLGPVGEPTGDLFLDPMIPNVYKEALGQPIVQGDGGPEPTFKPVPPKSTARRHDS